MSRRGRGSTGTGRPVALPDGFYEPEPATVVGKAGLEVRFSGEDGRSMLLPVGQLPLPGWHPLLAAALAEITGPTGTRRTNRSVLAIWQPTARLVRFLATLSRPPAEPRDLTAQQLDAFKRSRESTIGEVYAWNDIRAVAHVLTATTIRDQVAEEVLSYTSRRGHQLKPVPKPGYSDREFAQLIAAARADAANIRDRIGRSERLVTLHRTDLARVTPTERDHAGVLAEMAETGTVPALRGSNADRIRRRGKLASSLFVMLPDLAPLLVLFVALTGRNIETIKELPAEHRILDGRAVELRIVKRRRGQRRWFETVTWEIGRPSRQLHTPGGLYLLIHQLTHRSRARCGSPLLWSIWRNGNFLGLTGAAEHRGAFDKHLATNLYASDWARRHDLTADPPAGTEPGHGEPLQVDFNRLKTSVEVRTTRQMGGHLPSAARSNTIPVLFANYLRNDPTTQEWAQDVLGEALRDAEQSALAAHRRAAGTTGAALRVLTATENSNPTGADQALAHRVAGGDLDTAWTACANHDRHPVTGQPCQESFLACFQCGNCMVTRDHLPGLLGLLDALTARRQQLPMTEWWARYGMAWTVIRHDVLSRFSPAEITTAADSKPADSLLDLVETPWQHP